MKIKTLEFLYKKNCMKKYAKILEAVNIIED